MEAKLFNGDYIPDGLGGVVRCEGADALLERVLFRLTARRGQFPLLPRITPPPGRAAYSSRSSWSTGGRACLWR